MVRRLTDDAEWQQDRLVGHSLRAGAEFDLSDKSEESIPASGGQRRKPKARTGSEVEGSITRPSALKDL